MNYRTNEDKRCVDGSLLNYNLIHDVTDISDESGSAGEPVTLSEVKDYLRLEGFDGNSSGVAVQEPLSLTLIFGEFIVSDPLLIGATAIAVTREGTSYTIGTTAVGLQVKFDSTTGEITFANQGNSGGESIGVTYGIAGTAGSVDDFDFDDDLIQSLITEGRMWVEKFTGIAMVHKSLIVTATNGVGMLELPGPVRGSITVSDNGTTLNDLDYIGVKFPKLKTPTGYMLTFAYQVGYDPSDCPDWAKNAIKAYVADHYEYRGDDAPPAANKRAAQKCNPHKKVSMWG